MIRRIQAQIGRNAIDYSELPAGYYSADVRLVDDTGREISKQKVTISNIHYHTAKGGFITVGKTRKQKNLVQLGLSRPEFGFQFNGTILADHQHQWAAEGNVSRQMHLGGMQINTTLGMMAGEKGYGHYARLNTGNSLVGYLSLSYYEHPCVSVYAPRQQSRYISYSRYFGGLQIVYHWQGSGNRQPASNTKLLAMASLKFNIGFAVGAQKSRLNKNSAGQKNNSGFFIIPL